MVDSRTYEHEHDQPVDDFGITGPDLDLYRALVARYRKYGFGLVYAKHYAHGIIDSIHRTDDTLDAHRHAPTLADDEPGSDLDIARRAADVFTAVYAAASGESGPLHQARSVVAAEAADSFRDAYTDWLSAGIPDTFGIIS